ncbi:MAG: tripartite tricarboxylate transporter substrate binding protein [Candidimonas sp.]
MYKIICALALSFGVMHSSVADTFPSRPVTIIVPYGPGGATDHFVRTLASHLAPKLGQSVVVENAPGAGGIIGIQKLNNAQPDGHTLIVASGMEYEMQELANPGASPIKTTELQAIGNFGTQPMVLVASSELGVKTVDEFIALAKAKPGEVSIAAVGPGTALQLTSLMIQQAAGIDLIDVSYKGSGQIITDLVAGTVDVALMTPPTVSGMIQEGKLIPLAISEAQRSPVLPDVPSLAETPALKNIDTKIGYPLFGPKDMPQATADVLAKAANEVIVDPQFQESLLRMMVAPTQRVVGEDANTLTASQLAQFRKALAAQSAAP